MCHSDRLRTRKELMVQRREAKALLPGRLRHSRPADTKQICAVLRQNPAAQKCAETAYQCIHFIEGQPVMYFLPVGAEYRLTVIQEKVDCPPVRPAPILLTQCIRHLIMRQRYQRFYPVFAALPEYLPVKFNALLIRLLLITPRENPAPCNRKPQHLEAHLRHQRNIFFISVVKINRLMARIAVTVTELPCKPPRRRFCPRSDMIRNGSTLSAFAPAALRLVGSNRAAPQKALRKSVSFLSHYAASFAIASFSTSCFSYTLKNGQ